jgi:hypothetical protein
MYNGPVGVRCAECYGELPGGPRLSAREYAVAAAAGTPVALGAGFIAGLIHAQGLLIGALVGIGCGLAVAAAVGRTTNKGLALGLQALAGMMVVFGVFAGGLLAEAARLAGTTHGGFAAALTPAAGQYGLSDWGVTAFFATAAAIYWLRR